MGGAFVVVPVMELAVSRDDVVEEGGVVETTVGSSVALRESAVGSREANLAGDEEDEEEDNDDDGFSADSLEVVEEAAPDVNGEQEEFTRSA